MSETPAEIDYEALATSIIRQLLGRRLVWPRIRAVDAYPINHDLILTGRPVQEIHSITVTPSGRILDPADYQLSGGFRVRIARTTGLPRPSAPGCLDREIEIEYTYGSPPPAALARAITEYAGELGLADAGSSECKLPKRITSISRQGVSITMMDPADFIEKGQVGLPDVDSVIAAYNRGNAKARARLFTTRNPPARRLSAVAVSTEENP